MTTLYSALAWTWRSPTGYNVISGIVPDLTMLALLGAAVRHIAQHTCHEHGCFRVQFRGHPDEAGHIVCRKHFRAPIARPKTAREPTASARSSTWQP